MHYLSPRRDAGNSGAWRVARGAWRVARAEECFLYQHNAALAPDNLDLPYRAAIPTKNLHRDWGLRKQ